MNQNLLTEFKNQFEVFKQTNNYKERVAQKAFAPFAKMIIHETLKNEPLTNMHLTGLIQMFTPSCSDRNFQKYLLQNISDESIQNEILNQKKQLRQTGYTNAGKAAIIGLDSQQLIKVKKFVSDAFEVTSIEQAKILIKNFMTLNIPEIKQGIYSPWLHYINPKIFPVSNNTHIDFCKWFDIDRNYISYIDDFNYLMDLQVNQIWGTLISLHTFLRLKQPSHPYSPHNLYHLHHLYHLLFQQMV
jgi:hypothetical protein